MTIAGSDSLPGGTRQGAASTTRINLEEPVRVASPTRINLEEPVRVASKTRINLEEPVRVQPAQPGLIRSLSVCQSVSPSVSLSVCKG
jgi:hypothetical protein